MTNLHSSICLYFWLSFCLPSLSFSLSVPLSTKTSSELAQSVACNCQHYTRFSSFLSRTYARTHSRRQARNSACEVLIRDLHEKIELLPSPRPPSIPPVERGREKEKERQKDEETGRCGQRVNTMPHAATLRSKSREKRREEDNATFWRKKKDDDDDHEQWVLKPKRAGARLGFPSERLIKRKARKSDRDKTGYECVSLSQDLVAG